MRKFIAILTLISTLALSLVGCGGTEKKEEAKSDEAEGKKTVTVVTYGSYFPYSFMEDDKLLGFDIDVWEEIGKRCNYEIKWEIADYAAMFGMVDSGKADFAACQITVSKERQEKYDFSEIYAYNPYKLVVAENNNEIKSIEDLSGKTVNVSSTLSSANAFLEEYDKEGKIKRVFMEDGDSMKDVELGRLDGIFSNAHTFESVKEKGGYKVKQVGDNVFYEENAYPCLKNSGHEDMLAEVNGALKEMREDGTLSDISNKWLEKDVTEKE